LAAALVCLLVQSVAGDLNGFNNIPLGKPDPFVQASLLVVGMACRDGVALVAAHSSDKEGEAVLSYAVEKEPNDDDDDKSVFLDLPSSYGGPFRIHPIGSGGTALSACGWRADGSGRLLDVARDLAAEEKKYFGQDIDSFVLASELSVFLAENAVEGVGSAGESSTVTNYLVIYSTNVSNKCVFVAFALLSLVRLAVPLLLRQQGCFGNPKNRLDVCG
jgi:hypothetical protein